jgi:hypothetical protein
MFEWSKWFKKREKRRKELYFDNAMQPYGIGVISILPSFIKLQKETNIVTILLFITCIAFKKHVDGLEEPRNPDDLFAIAEIQGYQDNIKQLVKLGANLSSTNLDEMTAEDIINQIEIPEYKRATLTLFEPYLELNPKTDSRSKITSPYKATC